MDPNSQQVNPIPPPLPEPPKTFGWLKWVIVIIFVALLSSGTTYLVLKPQFQNQTAQPKITQTSTTPTVSQQDDITYQYNIFHIGTPVFQTKIPKNWSAFATWAIR